MPNLKLLPNIKNQISNFKMYLSKIGYSQSGFTLIEILIAITVLALLTVAIIPNYRRFSAMQQIHDQTSDLYRALRQTQYNAISKTLCSGDRPYPIAWQMKINKTQYEISALCQLNPTNINYDPSPSAIRGDPSPHPTTVFANGISADSSIDGTSCSLTSQYILIIFNKDSSGNDVVTYNCNAATFPGTLLNGQSKIQIKLTDTFGNYQTVTVSAGGVISSP